MADELGPIALDDGLYTGALRERLMDVALAQAEFWRAAAPWMVGVVPAPLIQLQDLAKQAGALEKACAATVNEARTVYRETRRRREEAQEGVGGAA